MSALAHFFEDEGLATTGISLVREHTEGMRPPRFLWTPFELGRPLGAPNEPDFQRRVVVAALRLLDAAQGPVLEDFPDDAPDRGVGEMARLAVEDPGADLAVRLQDEITQLGPLYDAAKAKRNRTTFGVSGLEPAEAGRFLSQFLDHDLPASYRDGLPLGEALKLASEDLKVYYLEAASAQAGHGSSRALNHWLWRQTAAGELLRALQPRCAQSSDRRVRMVAKRSLLPRAQVETIDGFEAEAGVH